MVTSVLGYAAIVAAFVATIRTNYFTLSKILHGSTRVPWMDEWAMIQEFILYKHGSPLWPILWSSYWGHRLVIPRLLFYADMQWASRPSMAWLTLAMQLVEIMLLCALSWLLIGRRSRALFALSVVVILNLMLSSLQMENFLWSMQFMFPMVYAAAGISFLCLALCRDKARSMFLAAGILAAAVASFTMPNGLLVWPILAAQAIYLKLERRLKIAVMLPGAAIIACYAWHYQRPPLGLSVPGMLRHPADAVTLVGFLLGAALNSIPLRLGIAVTLLAIVVGIYLGTGALRARPTDQSWLSALAAFAVFIVLSAASMVAGRLSNEFLAGGNVAVPSRYFTLIQAFWATLAVLVLYIVCRKPRSPLIICFYGALYLCLMFFNPQRQEHEAEEWYDVFRGADAVGAALIEDAPDEQLLSLLWPAKSQREEIIEFLRQLHLAVLAEPRAAWPGRRISELFPRVTDRCIGSVERALPLKDSAPETSWRVEGWAWDNSANRELDYLLIADPAGMVVGIARGGLHHRHVPGFFFDTPVVPVDHMRYPASEWLGYVHQPARSLWTVYGLLAPMNRLCVITDAGT
jgi:hypothetical protein